MNTYNYWRIVYNKEHWKHLDFFDIYSGNHKVVARLSKEVAETIVFEYNKMIDQLIKDFD